MPRAQGHSPRIVRLAWGRIEVEGYAPFKDAKIFPGGAREWDWRETGTRHVPGIQPADIEELIAHGAKAVVLSKGIWERLEVCTETLALLASRGIEANPANRGRRNALQRNPRQSSRRRSVSLDLLRQRP
jgi:hypothetical protein